MIRLYPRYLPGDRSVHVHVGVFIWTNLLQPVSTGD